jgi:hypothetical protein
MKLLFFMVLPSLHIQSQYNFIPYDYSDMSTESICNPVYSISVLNNKDAEGGVMKNHKIFVGFLCVLFISSLWIYGETDREKDISKQMEKLQEQVTKLEKKIESLEKKLKWLSKRSVEIPETFPKFRRMPKGWKQYEYNGIKFYIIPVKSDVQKADQQKK